jgi:hypothetical protein
MDKTYKEKFHYKIFKSVINKLGWGIPTQVILYDEYKLQKNNLTQFTNILNQIMAKLNGYLYTCDFSFIPDTLVIAYSSTNINNFILTSVAISIGAEKLYDYAYYSTVSSKEDKNIFPSLYSILYKALKTLWTLLKREIKNIVIYRDAVSKKQQKLIYDIEVPIFKKVLEDLNNNIEEIKKKEKLEQKKSFPKLKMDINISF